MSSEERGGELMLIVTFQPGSNEPALVAAAREYSDIWQADGARIVGCIERLSGLTFAESSIEATVIEGVSQSHPLRLRASYSLDVKRATLVHELCHRLTAGQPRGPRSWHAGADRQLETHKLLNLFLFDAWVELYGQAFAGYQVEVESARRPMYREAWEWALALDRPARAAELRRRLHPTL